MELGVMGNAIGDSAPAGRGRGDDLAETMHLGVRENGEGAEDAGSPTETTPLNPLNYVATPINATANTAIPNTTTSSSGIPTTNICPTKVPPPAKPPSKKQPPPVAPRAGVVAAAARYDVASNATRSVALPAAFVLDVDEARKPLMGLKNVQVKVVEQQQVQGKVMEQQPGKIMEQGKAGNNNHGTPGRCSDDGYGSSNSSPYGTSGQHKPSKHHGSASTLPHQKKELLVQVEEGSCLVTSLLLNSDSPGSGQEPREIGEGEDTSQTISIGNGTLDTTAHDEEKVSIHSGHSKIDDGRETWGTGADFLLSIIGFAVDLANVWRFPYLCYRNGGGAFLIPYTLMLIFGAVPLFYMELILGQFNRQGPISLWKICPLFKGVGFCAVIVAFYVSFYYNVIIGWALYFLVSSATTELPWLHCNNTWNSESCWDNSRAVSYNDSLGANETMFNNETLDHGPLSRFTPASEFFHRSVLEMQKSEGLHDLGLPKWQLVLCLATVYSMLYLSLFKGVKSSGKVVWATATLPYVVLSLLLARGLLLPGAAKGIAYYLRPQLARLADTQVWVDAAVQIFYSVGAGFGVHLSYASYNTFHNNCYRDCLVTTAVNCFTSFFSGFVIFTYLGFMSHKQGVPISSVATEGPGLVFQVYPEAVATLPGASIWAMLFFFMLIMLGLDSGMGGLECVITGLMDEFKWLFKNTKYAREKFTFCAVGFSFCVACFNVTPGGIYMFHLLDTYSAGISLLCSALFEAVAVSWFYGLDKFSKDVEAMLGFKPGLYWRICWKFISPSFIIGVVTFGLLYHQPLQYQEYAYPWWAEWVGWSLALSSVLMIPALAIYRLCVTPGSFRERFALSISPTDEHEEIKRTKVVSRFSLRHWLYV